ncbi:hypothetical protein H1235_15690 [Pseudoxanthomonas sp. NC8]|nr:hypothetical protein H1235_15690 [Pseudoxanthomonas sp. NC8]
MRRLLATIAVLMLAGCASHPVVDAAACAAQGGTVRRVGMSAAPTCVIPYPDAGRICSDNSDCIGSCRADPGAIIGDAGTGTCQRDSQDVFDCYLEIEAGVVVGGMCVN